MSTSIEDDKKLQSKNEYKTSQIVAMFSCTASSIWRNLNQMNWLEVPLGISYQKSLSKTSWSHKLWDFLKVQILKSGGSRYGDDSQVAWGGCRGAGAHVVAWWGLGAYPWAVVLPVVVSHPNNWILHLGTLNRELSHPIIGKNWHLAGQ